MKIQKLLPFGAFIVVATLVMLPAFKNGQLFLLDMPWPQHMTPQSYISNGVPLHAPLLFVLWLLQFVVPMWLLQKLLLTGLIVLAASGMFILLRYISIKKLPATISAALYSCSPYMLDRLYAGQWLVMAGYAYLPFFALLVYKAHRAPTKRSVAFAVLGWVGYIFISVHFWYMATLLLVPYVVYVLTKHAIPNKHYKHFKSTPVALFFVATLFVMSSVSLAYLQRIQQFGVADFAAFATRSLDSFGGFLTVLSLRGFWYSDGLVPQSLQALWQAVSLLCFGAFIVVLWQAYKKHKIAAVYAAIVFAVCLVLAVGYAEKGTQTIANIFRYLPGFNGMRETQKFVGVIAAIYAVALPLAAKLLLRHKKTAVYGKTSLTTTLLVGIFVLGVTLTSNAKKLQPYTYPSDWQQLRTLVKQDKTLQKVLVLPWDGYVVLPFAGNTYAANPAKVYFGHNFVTRSNSDNPQLDQARGFSRVDIAALQLVANDQAIPEIKNSGYTHILVLQLQDSASYNSILAASNQVQLQQELPTLRLYRVL